MRPDSAALAGDIERCMLRDRRRFARRLRGAPASKLAALAADVARSIARRALRAQNVPRPTYPQDLPIAQRKDEIARAIREHQVVVVCGETGSGKTTQLPKICLEIGRGIDGLIGHTQPRRLAARTLSARIAAELGVEVGRAVGHKIRFTDRTSDDTYVKLMTDGILLAETQGDRLLEQYDTLIIDEAHERSLNIDFLLGYIKRILPDRPELKVIVTSATIDPQRFAEHFGGAPVLEVSGRTYPVDVRYRPAEELSANEDEGEEREPESAIVSAIDELAASPGDVLVFLPGERAIRETAEALRKRHLAATEVLPLYARLSAGEQERIFRPHTGRRIVLSTNVAETSLTVPGIRYVVDTGLARLSRYDVRRKVQRLPIERISQASANQRAGRCGRISAGVCIRLYSEEDFRGRALYTPPEIRRTNLAAVILQMEALGLGDVERFPFIDPPETRAVRDGYATLFELGAIDEEHRLTRIGRELARLPVDPRVGRMLLAARDLGCVSEMLVIAAVLSVQEPRVRPHDQQDKADRAHERFRDETSDFLTYLTLWRAFQEQGQRLSSRKLRKWCDEAFVSFLRMREWQDVHDQLHQAMKSLGVRIEERPASHAAIHRALLTGLLGGVARKEDDRTYVGARNVKMNIFPGSGLARKRPEWIMAAEIVETDRLYARTVARIDPAWIEPLADHLVGRSYFEPHWEKNRGQVLAFERVSLYGLTLVPRRKVDFARIDADAAREFFLRGALVDGELRHPPPFLRHNQSMAREVEALQERSRRRDLTLDEQAIYDFYDRTVPAGIHSAASFERWRREAEARQPHILFLRREDVYPAEASSVTAAAFPDFIEASGLRVPLRYRFDPGEADDGITATVPLAAIRELAPGRFDWLVPGFLVEKIAALLESLPKSIRKNFVPVRETAERCAKVVSPNDEPLASALARELEVPLDSFRADALPPYLFMIVRIVDEAGRVVASSRDFAELRARFAARADEAFARLPKGGIERARVTSWDFGDLPVSIDVVHGPFVLRGYPALAADPGDGESVGVRVFARGDLAEAAHRAGLRRLYKYRLADVVKHLRRALPGIQGLCLWFSLVGSCDELKDDLIAAAIDRVCIGDAPLVRAAAEFEERAKGGRGALEGAVNALCDRAGAILSAYHEATRALPRTSDRDPYADVRDHLGTLVYRGFLTATPPAQLAHLPRYLKAVELRIARIKTSPQKDRERNAQLAPYQAKYDELAASRVHDVELDKLRWLLEEWRVSLFAQELKTAQPVSEKRIAEQLQRAQR